MEAKRIDRRVVVAVEGQNAVVAHHSQGLHQSDASATHGLDSHIHPRAFGQLVHRGHRIDHPGVDGVMCAQLFGDLQFLR